MPISLNLYLDTRASRNDEKTYEYPVKLAVSYKRRTAYIPTGINVLPAQWKNRKVTGRPDKARLNEYLESFRSRVRNMIYNGRDDVQYLNMTALEIKNDIIQRLNGDRASGRSHEEDPTRNILAAFNRFAESRKSERTREIYRVTARKIKQLVPNPNRLLLQNIDLEWLECFDSLLLARGNNASTRNLDFRNIRAVLKDAQKHKLIQENPFDDFKIPAGESPDRALTIEQLRLLKGVPVKPWERKYLDFFFISFYLIGMNTEDLLHLSEIRDGRVDYVRAKTQKKISVKVEPEAFELIERYKGGKHLLNMLDTYANTHNWTSKVDSVLKNIAERNGLPPITMYWARHTWATIAKNNLGISIDIIADAFGHQPEKRVTWIYIKRHDYSKVDSANRRVIDFLLNLSDVSL